MDKLSLTSVLPIDRGGGGNVVGFLSRNNQLPKLRAQTTWPEVQPRNKQGDILREEYQLEPTQSFGNKVTGLSSDPAKNGALCYDVIKQMESGTVNIRLEYYNGRPLVSLVIK